jgi:hypothetical protein
MTTPSKHNAPGQMAGYLFQPERALHHLAFSARGAMVGIETLDDVSVRYQSGHEIREQDKHYVSGKTPLADRSQELWNTLLVWLEALQSENFDLIKVEFFLVTNQTLASGLAYELMQLEGSRDAAVAFVAKLREVGRNPSQTLAPISEPVLKVSDDILVALIRRVRVFDATQSVHGNALKQKVCDHLHLPTQHADEIIQGLLGWIDELVLSMIREGKPAWIDRAAFDERYLRLLHRYQDIAFVRETEEALIHVDEDDRRIRRDRLFVRQLQWVGCREDADDDQILEAIDAHIRAGSEVARLSQAGVVTLEEFRAFDRRLVKRWKALWRIHVPQTIPPADEEQQTIGRHLLNQVLNHREPLAGQPTSEFYLTQGAYHHLADDAVTPAQLGWHPFYSDKMEDLTSSRTHTHGTFNAS